MFNVGKCSDLQQSVVKQPDIRSLSNYYQIIIKLSNYYQIIIIKSNHYQIRSLSMIELWPCGWIRHMTDCRVDKFSTWEIWRKYVMWIKKCVQFVVFVANSVFLRVTLFYCKICFVAFYALLCVDKLEQNCAHGGKWQMWGLVVNEIWIGTHFIPNKSRFIWNTNSSSMSFQMDCIRPFNQ